MGGVPKSLDCEILIMLRPSEALNKSGIFWWLIKPCLLGVGAAVRVPSIGLLFFPYSVGPLS